MIDELDLELGPGLNVLTGETGAGKSIIVEAINIALGERADAEVVRSGCNRAVVEMVVDVSASAQAMCSLGEAGLAPEDGRIVVSREVQKSGKSQCRISGRPVTLSFVKDITDRLVDTHGQHDHQFLLRPDRHLEVLDARCGEAVLSLAGRVAEGYARLRQLERELDQLQSDERERVRSIDLYQFQIREISDAKLTPGEEEELLAERLRLANAEKLHAGASAAFESMGDRTGEGCALDTIGEAVVALQGLSQLDAKLGPLTDSLQAAVYQVEDVARELRAYRDAIEFNPQRLQAVEDRLDLIRALKRKYGETIEEIVEYGRDLERRLELLTHSEERSSELAKEIEAVKAEVMGIAEELSALRRKGASAFAQAVELELEGLGMPKAVFHVALERHDLDETGIDGVEFLFSANPGEPPRPLGRIASGGEMSRVMLAIKSIMASSVGMPTLIFDEIDVGVGGRTAEVIGRKLDSLAEKAQVLCVTHLPHIASGAGEHFYIEKKLADGRTVVRVRRLTNEERVEELARMLGGAKPSQTAIEHAKEMLGIS